MKEYLVAGKMMGDRDVAGIEPGKERENQPPEQLDIRQIHSRFISVERLYFRSAAATKPTAPEKEKRQIFSSHLPGELNV